MWTLDIVTAREIPSMRKIQRSGPARHHPLEAKKGKKKEGSGKALAATVAKRRALDLNFLSFFELFAVFARGADKQRSVPARPDSDIAVQRPTYKLMMISCNWL